MQRAIRLRDVIEGDLPLFFEQQCDAEAYRMVAIKPRDREDFMRHWAKCLADPTITLRTIVWDDQTVGHIVCFEMDGKWEVGYWIGRPYWGQGITTKALSEFLNLVVRRPLYASTASHNLASAHVLKKSGFLQVGIEKDFFQVDGAPVEGLIFKLEAPERLFDANP